MRAYDENGYVIPHCNLCMQELKLGEKVVMDSIYSLVHLRCKHMNQFENLDEGEFSEVIGRNFHYFPNFVKQFNETGVYKRKAPLD
ncbi:hypothetical protein KM915_03640 [Cytobacillus oceanisediminis]|uniref:hypothetical protein n=1 Tax=Cytobacillus oceanisediminis TaxID=665099 RepID=UPI001C221598|nr:hypothetical protein [Cytobacillus oceanisediminis]MBU8729148.1 hypothetical protein [Cytobacillus oceanisediminis]